MKKRKKKGVHKHLWKYGGGEAKCSCGKYLQPSGKITDTPTGRKKRKKIIKK